MSDTSQGPGWWMAADNKWYAPESHPDYEPPSQSESRAPSPTPNSASAGSVTSGVGTSATKSMPSPMQWTMIGAGVAGILGTLTPWITASAGFFSASKNGIATGDGKIAVVLALLALGSVIAIVMRPNKIVSVAAVVLFGLLAILSVYEIVNISSKSYSSESITITASVGIGVYLSLLGGIVGVAAWIFDLRRAGTTKGPE